MNDSGDVLKPSVPTDPGWNKWNPSFLMHCKDCTKSSPSSLEGFLHCNEFGMQTTGLVACLEFRQRMKTSPLSDKLALEWCEKLLVRGGARTQIQRDLSKLIYGIISQPQLGNATTGQLLDEVKARVDLGYRTVGEETDFDLAP